MADDNEQPSDHGTRQKNDHMPGLCDERNVKTLTRRERLSRAGEKLPVGPNPFAMTVVVLLNVLIFATIGYMIWDIIWDVE